MTVEEVINEVKQLSSEDRRKVLELLVETLRNEQRLEIPPGPSLSRVRGLLKPDGPIPTDEELSDIYSEHLLEKYT